MQPTTLPPLRPEEFMPAWQKYTPGYYYLKLWQEIKGSETGPEESFADAITDALFAGKGYTGIMRVPLPKGLSKEKAEEIRSHMVFLYLDSHDDLPAFPTAADWANAIGAPVEYVAYSGSNLLSHLPSLEEGTLQPFFDVACRKLFMDMLPLNRTPDLDFLMPEKTVRQRFTSLAIGHRSALAGLRHPQLVQMIDDAVKAFAPKLREYRIALQNKKQGSFDALLADVKERKLSKLEAIKFIVYRFLG